MIEGFLFTDIIIRKGTPFLRISWILPVYFFCVKMIKTIYI